MVTAKVEYKKGERGFRANCALAVVTGVRAQRPNLRQLYRSLMGPEKRKPLKQYESMLKESRARVRASKSA